MNRKIGTTTINEIREAMRNLSGPACALEATRLAHIYGLSASQVYGISKGVRPQRQKRADKGKRNASLLENDVLRLATELVVNQHMDPDLALETACLNLGQAPVSLDTFRRYLRENGLSKSVRLSQVKPHRPWEASFPTEIFQFDISGLKRRYIDPRTRTILKLRPDQDSTNHPRQDKTLVPIWRFLLVDDFSRRKYLRYFACLKPTSSHVIEFMLEAFREMGVPRQLYTDNDPVIVSARMKRAADMLNAAFADSGGFALTQHLPGNAPATGKVENPHKVVEKHEKLIAMIDDKFFNKVSGDLGRLATLEKLNFFAKNLRDLLNWKKVHRATGQTPMSRWNSFPQVLRIPPPDTLDWAFKADLFEDVKVSSRVTISVRGEGEFQLPRKAPYVDWAERETRIAVLWPPQPCDFFVAIHDGDEYPLVRVLATVDKAGEFKQLPETTGQKLTKEVKTSYKKRDKTKILLPLVDVAPDIPAAFPQPKKAADPELLKAFGLGQPESAEPAQVMTFVPPQTTTEVVELLTPSKAIRRAQEADKFASPISEADRLWVFAAFGERTHMEETEFFAALELRHAAPRAGLKVVK